VLKTMGIDCSLHHRVRMMPQHAVWPWDEISTDIAYT
jgi:hypothetical protein